MKGHVEHFELQDLDVNKWNQYDELEQVYSQVI